MSLRSSSPSWNGKQAVLDCARASELLRVAPPCFRVLQTLPSNQSHPTPAQGSTHAEPSPCSKMRILTFIEQMCAGSIVGLLHTTPRRMPSEEPLLQRRCRQVGHTDRSEARTPTPSQLLPTLQYEGGEGSTTQPSLQLLLKKACGGTCHFPHVTSPCSLSRLTQQTQLNPLTPN